MRRLVPLFLTGLSLAAACSSSGEDEASGEGGTSVPVGGASGASAGTAGMAGSAAGAGGTSGAAGTSGASGNGGSTGGAAGNAGAGGTSGAAGASGKAGAAGSTGGAGGTSGAAGASGKAGSSSLTKLVVVVRTGDGATDGTNDAASFCVSGTKCFPLDNAEIDDRESGQVDHLELEAKGMKLADIEHIELTTNPGDNAWKPTCVAVVADGELLYCNDQLGGISIGNTGSEKKSFVDTMVTKKTCESCYRGGDVITHGPMVGHTTTTSARVWARAGSARSVSVRHAATADLAGAVSTAAVQADPAADFTVEIPVDGLTPASTVYYALEVDGKIVTPKPYPSFRTAPAAKAVSTFAFGSCARWENAKGNAWEGFAVFDALRAKDPDALLLIGDNHYGNTTDTARQRFFYRMSRDVASFAGLLPRVPTWAIWDDHDFGPNNSDGTIAGKERSLAAFDDYWANPSAGSGGVPGIWTSFVWGETEVFLLDDRYHRIGGVMLGTEQKAWLKAGLAASKATFKLVVSGSTWHDGGSNDSWDAYAKERDEILDDAMKKKVGGIVLLGGDIHRSAAFKVRGKTATGYPIYEYVVSPFGNAPAGCSAIADQLFCESGPSFFGVIEVDSQAADPKLTFRLHDATGKVLQTHATKKSELTPP